MAETTKTISDSDIEMAGAGIIEMPVQRPAEKLKHTENTGNENDNNESENNQDAPENKEDKTKVKNAEGAGGSGNNDPEKNKIEELSDEDLVKLLSKRTGKQFSSLEDLSKPAATETKILTAEEAEAEKEKRQAEALTFGLKRNLFTKKEYDQYQRFITLDKKEVVLDQFFEDLKKDEPTIDRKEAEERFDELYHQFSDEKSFNFKKGTEQIDALYNKIKTDRFSKILDVEEVYNGVQKNLTNAKVFKSKIEDTFKNIDRNLKFKIDKEDINTPLFTDEQVEKAMSDYLTPEMMAAVTAEDGTINTADIEQEIKKDFVFNNLNAIVSEAAIAFADKKLLAYRKSRKAANFSEDANETDMPNDKNVKSGSDAELEEARKEGIIR